MNNPSPLETYNFAISIRLIAEEAEKRGYAVYVYEKTSATKDYVIEFSKPNKTLLLSNWRTMLDSPLGLQIGNDKITTYAILRKHKIPYPSTYVIRRAGDDSITDSLVNFLNTHKTVVVKPSNTDHGRGVSVGITDAVTLNDAVKFALHSSKDADILVQSQIMGQEYRFLVLSGRVIAVANRRPPTIQGDGKRTVIELLEEKNSHPYRGAGHTSPLTTISREEVSRFIGNDTFSYIPAVNEAMELLPTSNLSRGGEAIDCTDIASSDLKSMAESAATACMLGIAGIDIMTSDIRNGTSENSYIIEVNPQPGLRMHHFPIVGKPRNVAGMIVDELEQLSPY